MTHEEALNEILSFGLGRATTDVNEKGERLYSYLIKSGPHLLKVIARCTDEHEGAGNPQHYEIQDCYPVEFDGVDGTILIEDGDQ